jgi:hypothetical protein
VPAGSPTLADLERAIRTSWSASTSDDPDEWTPENPTRGQCGVAAHVLRDLVGGEVLVAEVRPAAGAPTERHAWNRLPSGLEIDLTWDQFRAGETLGPPAVHELGPDWPGYDRYRALSEAVRARLGPADA